MTIQNTPLRLEIGENQYFSIVGKPEISDSLTTHGKTATIQIQIERDGQLPTEGSLALITRLSASGYENIFCGICGQTPTKLLLRGDELSLTLNSFVEYTQRKTISGYRATTLLASHIINAAILAGVYNVPDITKQLLDIFVAPNPDNNESFLFEFNNGNFQSFLDSICAKTNCSWTIEQTGITLLSGLVNANANLFVRSNIYLNNVAPKATITIPENGDAICATGVFWTPGMSYTVIPPIASVIRIYGKNGKNITGDITSLNPDILRYRAEEDRDNYPFLDTADEITVIKITLPNMTTFNLLKRDFDPENPIPTDGSLEAAIRKEEHKFYVSPVDVPADSLIEVYHVTYYIYYELENPQAISIIKAADGAGDGKIYYDIDDPNITDIPTAVLAAEQAEAIVCAVNFNISFGTNKVKGWQVGQQFTVIHLARNIYYLVTIQEVRRKLLLGNRDFYQISAATIQLYKPTSLMDMLINKVNNPPKERFLIFTPDI